MYVSVLIDFRCCFLRLYLRSLVLSVDERSNVLDNLELLKKDVMLYDGWTAKTFGLFYIEWIVWHDLIYFKNTTIYLSNHIGLRWNLTDTTGLVVFRRGSGRFRLESSWFIQPHSVRIHPKRNKIAVERFRLTSLQLEFVGSQRNRSNDDWKIEDFTWISQWSTDWILITESCRIQAGFSAR